MGNSITAYDVLKTAERLARFMDSRSKKTSVIKIKFDNTAKIRGANARRGLKMKSDTLVIDLGKAWQEPVVNEMLRHIKDGFKKPRGKPEPATLKRRPGKFWSPTGHFIESIDKEPVADGWVITFPTDRLEQVYTLNRAKKANRFMDARTLWKKVTPTVKKKARRRAKVKKKPLNIRGLQRYPGD